MAYQEYDETTLIALILIELDDDSPLVSSLLIYIIPLCYKRILFTKETKA